MSSATISKKLPFRKKKLSTGKEKINACRRKNNLPLKKKMNCFCRQSTAQTVTPHIRKNRNRTHQLLNGQNLKLLPFYLYNMTQLV